MIWLAHGKNYRTNFSVSMQCGTHMYARNNMNFSTRKLNVRLCLQIISLYFKDLGAFYVNQFDILQIYIQFLKTQIYDLNYTNFFMCYPLPGCFGHFSANKQKRYCPCARQNRENISKENLQGRVIPGAHCNILI